MATTFDIPAGTDFSKLVLPPWVDLTRKVEFKTKDGTVIPIMPDPTTLQMMRLAKQQQAEAVSTDVKKPAPEPQQNGQRPSVLKRLAAKAAKNGKSNKWKGKKKG